MVKEMTLGNVSLIAPALNEEEGIATFIEVVDSANILAGSIINTLIIVNDGSTDDTLEAIKQVNKPNSFDLKVVNHDVNKGIVASWLSGLEASKDPYVCFIDSDLQNDPSSVKAMVTALDYSNADVVQAVRSEVGRPRDFRLFSSRALNTLLNVVFRMRARDSKSGFFLTDRQSALKVIDLILPLKIPQTYVGVAFKTLKFEVLEVETLFANRVAGTSFLAGKQLRTICNVLIGIPAALWRMKNWKRKPAYNLIVSKHSPLGMATSARLSLNRDSSEGSAWREWLWRNLYFRTWRLHTWNMTRQAEHRYLELKNSEFISKEELEEIQLLRLRKILRHAEAKVPFYREKFKSAGVTWADVTSLGDIAKFPLLSKADVRENLHFQMFAEGVNVKGLHRISTSGSTGEPFVTYADRDQLEIRFAATLRALEMTGWRFGQKQMRLWHQTLGMNRVQATKERIDAFLMRRTFVPAFELDESGLNNLRNLIEKKKPFLIDGYAESLNFLAGYVLNQGELSHSPKAVMSSAQALTKQVRNSIQNSLGATVFDKYGSREFSGIAYECGFDSGHHVVDESYIVEILVDGRPARPGEVGEVVITDLTNYSVPLIRYRIGDLATAIGAEGSCECGRPHSRIGRIEGRTQAIVKCGNGVYLPGTFFAHFFKEHDSTVRFFQIVQDVEHEFHLNLVLQNNLVPNAVENLVDELRIYCGSAEQTKIIVDIVDEIPLLKTGKRSPVVSRVATDFLAEGIELSSTLGSSKEARCES